MGGLADFTFISNKCDVLGTVFEISAQENYNSYDFVSKVMTDKSLDWLYTTDDCQDWSDGEFLYSVIKHNIKLMPGDSKTILDPVLMKYAGQVYKWWMVTRSTDRKQVYKILPLNMFVDCFGFYCSQSYDYIIDDAIRMRGL